MTIQERPAQRVRTPINPAEGLKLAALVGKRIYPLVRTPINPAEGLKRDQHPPISADQVHLGPNTHQPSRGIETAIARNTDATTIKVRTPINPAEGLKRCV